MAFGTPGQPIFGAPAQDPGAILAQVDQLRQSGRPAEAERLCRSLVEAQPNLPSALNVLGLLLRARGEPVEAESLMRRAIAAAPREPALHNNLGNILYARGELAGAESAYRKAITLKSDFADACYNLGIVLRDLDRADEALVAQRRAVALRPAYPQAQVQLGVLLNESGAAAEALGVLEAVAAAAPGYYDAQYYRGTVLAELQRYDEAIAALQAAVALAPNRHEARYALAKAFAQGGREPDALLAFQRTFEAKPDFLPALFDFTALAWSMGNDVRSLDSYAYARAKAGDTPDLLLAEANLRMRFTDSLRAEVLLREARHKAPDRSDIANALGRALVLQKRLDESFPLFREAIASEPGAVRHRQDFAEALLKRGEAGEAVRLLEEAVALSPHDQITLAYLSLAYRERGDGKYDSLVNANFVREYEIAPPAGFSDIAAFNRALAEELANLHTRKVAPLDQTLTNGTQTQGSLFTLKSRAIELVREQIRAAVADYISSLPDGADHPMLSRKSKDFSFSGSWSCRLRSTGFHTNHVHDQGWISSAYYVSLPEEIAKGGQGGLKFGESKFRLGERDRPAHVIKPAVGKLVLFPSYFWHGTVPFESPDMRLAIAFDVTPGKAAPNRFSKSSL